MKTVIVKIGSPFAINDFGEFTIHGETDLVKKVNERIEQLHPLNSSEEGRELYKQRFRDKPIFYKTKNVKEEYKQVNL